MNKKTAFIIVICLIFLFVLCGCTEDTDTMNSGSKTYTWNAQNWADDLKISTQMSGGSWKSKMDFETLNVGDTLIVTDEISNITYSEFFYDVTQISFDVQEYKVLLFNSSVVSFLFEGDITDSYTIGDTVKITVTIKNYEIANETAGGSIEFEGYEEGSDPKGISSTQILPTTCIKKI
jgi:hypothetical protein